MRSTNPTPRTPVYTALRDLWQRLRKDLLDSYRPELHYMRGPGPRWLAKHVAIGHAGHSAIN
jgi:hypothetical protein